MKKLLEVNNLKISFNTEFGYVEAVKDISFSVGNGEVLAIVGESGSGKSVSAYAVAGLMKNLGANKEHGTVTFNGSEIDYADEKRLRMLRGGEIGYIFQEPMVSLNPLHNIEKQITERLVYIEGVKQKEATERALELLNLVGIKNAEKRIKDYPHMFSGGERQRIMIALAIICNPKLLIADEPTTALDVTTQIQILDLLKELQAKLNMSVVLITHDLAIVKKYADNIVVVRHGYVVEQGSVEAVFNNPKEQYTKELITVDNSKPINVVTDNSTMLDVKNVSVIYNQKTGIKAVDNVSLSLTKGYSLGIVGESGSGKTSLMRAILRLISFDGNIMFDGRELSTLKPKELRAERKNIQAVFQDPFGSLNPRMTIQMIVEEGLRSQGMKDKNELARLVGDVLENVGLPRDIANRYPHEFSGGQRQRIAIARAIILKPKLIIFDEPTSSLDRNVQLQIISLLKEIQIANNITYIFISHDINLVHSICHDMIIMKEGDIIERGKADDIFANPQQEYTKVLVDSVQL